MIRVSFQTSSSYFPSSKLPSKEPFGLVGIMGNNLIHFNTCAISYIVSTTNSHLYKMYDVYKAKEVQRGREDTMTFVISAETLHTLLTAVGVNKEGVFCVENIILLMIRHISPLCIGIAYS